jgi:hypothetical protein
MQMNPEMTNQIAQMTHDERQRAAETRLRRRVRWVPRALSNSGCRSAFDSERPSLRR